MNKIYIKLIAMALALVLSASVMVMSSYAWFVLSGNPVATGIQVAIGGGNTILTAPNVLYTIDKGTYNIPGYFSDRLNFSQQENYAYLQTLGSLTPVSTYNGVDWLLPEYYDGTDALVQSGKIPSGALKDISEFSIDSELSHANLPAGVQNQKKIEEGSYIYLDFWVVSPGGDYKLRVSTGDETADGGSFVIDMMEPEKTETGYILTAPRGNAAAAVRIGFLANDLLLTDQTMLTYQNSPYKDSRFTALKGLYQEPESGTAYLDANRFTIYEPNADFHPELPAMEGRYVETSPLALEDDVILAKDARDRLTVQKKSSWTMANETQTKLEQQLPAALFGKNWQEMDANEVFARLYGHYLQGQIATLVDKGDFVRHTGNLYAAMAGKGYVSREEMLGSGDGQTIKKVENAGATDDVYIIQLERNVPQRIRMFIWLEGQDIDCVDSVNSARFAVNIELAGGSDIN